MIRGKVKISLCLTISALCHEGVWGSGNTAQTSLTSAPHGNEWLVSRLDSFTTEEVDRGMHWIGGRMRRTFPLLGIGLRPLSRPTHNQYLYRLSYPDSQWLTVNLYKLAMKWHISKWSSTLWSIRIWMPLYRCVLILEQTEFKNKLLKIFQ
jgi:hypothetical protein